MIETLIHMDITVSGGLKTLKPGDRVDIPIEKAKKLFKLAGPRKVRIIIESAQLQPGKWVKILNTRSASYGHEKLKPR